MRAIHPRGARGARQVAAVAADELLDEPALPVRRDALLGGAERQRLVELVAIAAARRLEWGVDARGDLLPQLGILHEDRALDGVAQLAHVARPVEPHQAVEQ